MARTKEKVHKVDVVRHEGQLNVPQSMSLDDAIKVLTRQRDHEQQRVAMTERIDVFPWEGALALKKALQRMTGFAHAKTQVEHGLFGMKFEIPPREINVEVAPGVVESVPWGHFTLPGTSGTQEVICDTERNDKGQVVFALNFNIQRKYEPLARELAKLVRKIAFEESIYRGKSIRMKFRDEDGDLLSIPQPKFIDLSHYDFSTLVYTRSLERRIDTEVFAPLRYPEQLKQMGTPLKRGVLLAGPYGTGKTLLAHRTAQVANEAGWTYIYVEDVRELAEAMRFARQYAPAVIFGEDLDRVVKGERSAEMDQVLNTIDGIDSKDQEVMVVLTTNHLEHVHEAMLRPGRLDVILNILPPDAEAVQRLILAYGRGMIDSEADLTEVGALLDGEIPAVIREVVERSKLYALTRTGDVANMIVTGDDLYLAAETVREQRSLIGVRDEAAPTPAEQFGLFFGAKVVEGIQQVVEAAEGLNEYRDNSYIGKSVKNLQDGAGKLSAAVQVG